MVCCGEVMNIRIISEVEYMLERIFDFTYLPRSICDVYNFANSSWSFLLHFIEVQLTYYFSPATVVLTCLWCQIKAPPVPPGHLLPSRQMYWLMLKDWQTRQTDKTTDIKTGNMNGTEAVRYHYRVLEKSVSQALDNTTLHRDNNGCISIIQSFRQTDRWLDLLVTVALS